MNSLKLLIETPNDYPFASRSIAYYSTHERNRRGASDKLKLVGHKNGLESLKLIFDDG